METREKVEALESEKLECAKTMRKSDEHLMGCQKKGLIFSEKYPQDYEEYIAANKRYNEIEEELKPLYEELKREEEKVKVPESMEV